MAIGFAMLGACGGFYDFGRRMIFSDQFQTWTVFNNEDYHIVHSSLQKQQQCQQ